MLGFIQGKIISRNIDSSSCVVFAQGLGYEILIPKRSLEKFSLASEVSLWLHTHVREDILALYGFESENDKLLFRTLLTVSGLGPKTALSILSEFGTDTLIELILSKRVGDISKAPGLGKKTAEKLVIELTGKIEKFSWAKESIQATAQALSTPGSVKTREDLFSALTHLGYAPHQIKFALDKVMARPESSFEGLLKLALQELSNRSISNSSSNSRTSTGELSHG